MKNYDDIISMLYEGGRKDKVDEFVKSTEKLLQKTIVEDNDSKILLFRKGLKITVPDNFDKVDVRIAENIIKKSGWGITVNYVDDKWAIEIYM